MTKIALFIWFAVYALAFFTGFKYSDAILGFVAAAVAVCILFDNRAVFTKSS